MWILFFLFLKLNKVYRFLEGGTGSYFHPFFLSFLDFSNLIPQSRSTHTVGNYSFLEEYPNCVTTIYDQRHESTCYAYASITVFSQRFCRETGKKFDFNPYDLIYCDKLSSNSFGGHEQISWRYLQLHGVVNQSCSPYIQNSDTEQIYMRPYKPQKITQIHSSYCQQNTTCQKFYAKLHSQKTLIGEDEIRKEIKNHGPVTAVFEMTDDFPSYDSRYEIYQSKGEKDQDLHTIVLLGWGEENGIPYWIGQNSYGKKWGKNGYFRILRGVNHCGIEKYASSISPKVYSF